MSGIVEGQEEGKQWLDRLRLNLERAVKEYDNDISIRKLRKKMSGGRPAWIWKRTLELTDGPIGNEFEYQRQWNRICGDHEDAIFGAKTLDLQLED